MSDLSRFGTWRPPRGGLPLVLGLLALAGCQEQRVSSTLVDVAPPVVSLKKTSGDTMDVNNGLQFQVTATDNLGLKTLSIVLTGGYTARIDSTFRTAVTNLTLPVNFTFPANTSAGGRVYIRITATDGSNNSAVVQDSVLLTNINALIVTLIRPVPGLTTSAGKGVFIQVSANQNQGIKKIGWTSVGVVVDSFTYLVPPTVPPSIFPDTVIFGDTLTIPAGVLSGNFNISGFAEDSSGRRVATPPVTVSIQSVATDNTPPVVTFTVGKRVEIRDTITVRAIDPSGITKIGWIGVDLGTGLVVGGDSITSAGTLTDVIQPFNMNFQFTTLPYPQVIVSAFAVDGATALNRGISRFDTTVTSPPRSDTITVVAGITKGLPAGGRIADAVYNRNLNEIYLTNVDLNCVEIFRIVDTAFVAHPAAGCAPVPAVGARPWGIALWPGDTTAGGNGDTVIVANSGGTNLSIVDMFLRREVARRSLPAWNVASVQTAIDPTTGLLKADITNHRFSDRPEYLAAVCRGAVCKPRGAGDVIAVYSTTPTQGQSGGFALRGTMRWENLTSAAPESHFFWEHAAAAVKVGEKTDTLRIDAVRGFAVQRLLDEACGVTVNINELAFLDTTFVRNSGNFGRILVGESGQGSPPLVFARALTYDGNAGAVATCTRPLVGSPFPLNQDVGISPSVNVRDFITNASAPIRSIGVNFNGLTNLIRADSIYVLDRALRLQGLLQIPGPNFGMDLNFDHKFDAACGGTAGSTGVSCTPNGFNPNDRLLFAARPDANIDAFDTYFYGRVATIPLRDPVIGPLRVTKLPTGEQLLIGVTVRGVVVARLPAITNIYQARIWGAPVQ